jgi:hypothetical protein
VGRANANDLTVPLCLNHHRKLHVRMEEAGVELGEPDDRTILDILVAILTALAAFFVTLAETLSTWAEELSRVIAALDGHHCGWRQLPDVHR